MQMQLIILTAFIGTSGLLTSASSNDSESDDCTQSCSHEINDESGCPPSECIMCNNREQLQESKRRINISGFIAACQHICNVNYEEYVATKLMHPNREILCDHGCEQDWRLILQDSQQPVTWKLRGDTGGTALLDPSEYENCAKSLCSSYRKCYKHTHGHPATVQVLKCLANSTMSLSIQEILQNEKPENLLNMDEMRFVNRLQVARGEKEFPVLEMVKECETFVIPQMC